MDRVGVRLAIRTLETAVNGERCMTSNADMAFVESAAFGTGLKGSHRTGNITQNVG